MGRPEKPLSCSDPVLRRLAQDLRNARIRADLTFRQMAGRAPGFSRTTLQRAASGSLPTRDTVTAYAKACDTDPGPLLDLWRQVAEERRALHRAAPSITKIDNADGLGAALYNLRLDAGSPSSREIEKRTRNNPGTIRVPRTTVHRILYQQRFPSSDAQLTALLVALGVPPAHQAAWLQAWSRANHRRPIDRRADRNRTDRLQSRIARPTRPQLFNTSPLPQDGLADSRALP